MSLNKKDDKIFDNVSLSDLLSDIYKNSTVKKSKIDVIMDSFLPLIKQSKDVAYVGSVVKDLLDVSVKNDEQLVKIATIAQRLITSDGAEDELGLTDEMKEELLATVREHEEDNEKIEEELSDIEEKKKNIDGK